MSTQRKDPKAQGRSGVASFAPRLRFLAPLR